MKKSAIIFLLTIICFISLLWSDDVDVNLNSGNGSTGFVIKNNTATPDSLFKVKSNGDIGLKSGKFLNYGSPTGATGYGFRDNAGILQYKNSGGSWTPFGYVDNDVTSPYGFPSSSYTYAQMHYDHGAQSADLKTYDNMPVFSIPAAGFGYASMLPMTTIVGTPYRCFTNGTVEITTANGTLVNCNYPSAPSAQPVFFHVLAGGTGTYRVTASVGVQGINNETLEIEVFRGTTAAGPWITGVNDIESLSTIYEMTQNKYSSGSVSGYMDLAAGDYVGLFCRTLGNISQTATAKVICINFNLMRLK